MIPGITWITETTSKSSKKISEQHTGKALHQGAKKNNHFGRRTHSLESTNAKGQNVYHGK